MTPSDEKELVLGNKQLISLFFVVAALCGVFFAVGYIVGRNSGKATVTGMSDASGTTAAGQIARQQPEPPRETTSDSTAAPVVEPQPSPQVETRPAQDSGATTPSAVAAVEPPKEFRAPKATGVNVSTPETGASYLQVTALPRTDADNMVRSLREQSFPAIVATSSKEGLFRVLVGPYHDTPQVADAKNRLKTLGFANAFVQKQ